MISNDLPLYHRVVQTQKFEGISSIITLVETRKLYSDLRFDSFHGDGVHGNYATYQQLNE